MSEPAFRELPVYCAKGARGISADGRLVNEGSELQLLFREGGEVAGATAEGAVPAGLRFFVVLEGELGGGGDRAGSPGSFIVPYGLHCQGSTVFLPFAASEIYWFDACDRDQKIIEIYRQKWTGWQWGRVGSESGQRLEQSIRPESLGEVMLPLFSKGGGGSSRRFVVYAKVMLENQGWGELIMASSRGIAEALERGGGIGDYYIPSSLSLKMNEGLSEVLEVFPERRKVYQLFPRLFNNIKNDLVESGTAERNGCGKWNDITSEALESIRAMGFTDIWLTGILQHATGTAYPKAGLSADPPDLLKGVAGSPYAIKNPFDLSPDCATEPGKRFDEFRALLERIHNAGMRALIDFVPNHLARCYLSDPVKGMRRLGAGDDASHFFLPGNYFYYVQGEGGLRLPTMAGDGKPLTVTCEALGGCTGRYEREADFARVSGNNVVSASPSIHDWYETVKLNYGFNFLSDEGCYPSARSEGVAIPPVWRVMDAVLAHWQEQGVDGFRCDMAHLVPPEFWMWAIARARQRASQAGRNVAFIAEAYDEDGMRVPSRSALLRSLYEGRGNIGVNLIDAGFDLVYDGVAYKKLKQIYDGTAWANDLDACFLTSPFLTAHSLRYAENHDEVRLESSGNWGSVGMNVGRPVCAILYGAMAGGMLLYNGQEVGEPGSEKAGYGGGNGRTTIFDYWTMPELQKWVNGGKYDGARLNNDQKALRASYGRLLNLISSRRAFCHGLFLPLNEANRQSGWFGRLPGEEASGHWMYAFLRYDPGEGELFLVVVNLHESEAFRNVELTIPGEMLALVGLVPGEVVTLSDRLSSQPPLVLKVSPEAFEIPVVPPLTPYYFEVSKV